MNLRLGYINRWLLASTFLSLAACSQETNLADLRAFTAAERARKAAPIPPLPSIESAESFEYTASLTVNPFSRENVLPIVKETIEIPLILPDQDRIRQPLEYFPLDALRMVGTLQQDERILAIIFAPDDTIHQVEKGHYAGTQLGKIVEVRESEILLEETVKQKNGGWEKRKASLALSD